MDPSDKIIQLAVTKCTGATEILHVHQGVLCKSSQFFQNTMKPEWAESREPPNTVSLPDDKATTVSSYINWLYSGNIPVDMYKKDESHEAGKQAQEMEKIFVVLVEAYVYGEKILDTKYKNAAMKALGAAIRSSKWNMGPKSVDIAYKGTPSTSPLRRFIAECVAYKAFDDSQLAIGWMQFMDGYPREALVDAMKATICKRAIPGGIMSPIESYLEEEK